MQRSLAFATDRFSVAQFPSGQESLIVSLMCP